MNSEKPQPIYVDKSGRSYYQGTPENPFNAKQIPLYNAPLEVERAFMHGGREAPIKRFPLSSTQKIGGSALETEIVAA